MSSIYVNNESCQIYTFFSFAAGSYSSSYSLNSSLRGVYFRTLVITRCYLGNADLARAAEGVQIRETLFT